MRTRTRLGAGLVGAALLAAPLTAAAAPTEQPTDGSPVDSYVENPDQLTVSVVGDGVASGNQAVPVTLDTYAAGGELLSQTPLPTEASGDQHAFTLGADRDQAGAVQQSADSRFLTLGGYDAEPGWVSEETGGTGLNDASAEELTRVIARVDADGAVDTSTAVEGAYHERHIRGVVTDNGSRYWTGGHGNDTEGDARGGVLYVEHGQSTPTPVTVGGGQVNNTRVPSIIDGQLYVSSDRDDYNGIASVGQGLPTEASEMSLVAEAPAGREVAHDFTRVDDHLYVAYTDGDAALVRYELVEGAWVEEAAFPGEYWAVTGRTAGDDVVLYAVRGSSQGNELVALLDDPDETGETVPEEELIAQAEPGYAFRGVDFAAGYVPEDDPVSFGDPPATARFDTRLIGGQGSALSAVLGAENPTATGQIMDPMESDLTAAEVTVASGNTDIVEDATITVDEDGRFEISADPMSTGSTHLAVHVTTEDGRSSVSYLDYAVSNAPTDPSALIHVGTSDASAAEDVGNGHMLVADDDSNVIRLYGPTGGEPVKEFPIGDEVPDLLSGEVWDLEGSARDGDTVYWTGSMGNSRSGNLRPDRDIVVETRIIGSGAETELEYVAHTHGVRDALVAWDAENLHGEGADAFQFSRATQEGYSAEGPDSLNVEGAALSPEGTLWLGFRSPLTPVDDDEENLALIVEVTNLEETLAGAEPEIGEHVELDLDGRAIRDLASTEDGNYLIQAGSADDEGNFALFGWTGNPEDAPVESQTPLGLEGWNGSYESLPMVPSLEDGTIIRVMQDAGTEDIYGTGTEAQDLPQELKKFPSHDYVLNFDGAFASVTDEPTNEPTDEPTSVPTDGSTPAPSDDPTGNPTGTPSATPTDVASDDATVGDLVGDEADRDGALAATGASGIVISVIAAVVLLIAGILLALRSRTTQRGHEHS
ncbi:MAG: hypothetical protein ACTHZ5_06730 [Micrococcaceae bacterium]